MANQVNKQQIGIVMVQKISQTCNLTGGANHHHSPPLYAVFFDLRINGGEITLYVFGTLLGLQLLDCFSSCVMNS